MKAARKERRKARRSEHRNGVDGTVETVPASSVPAGVQGPMAYVYMETPTAEARAKYRQTQRTQLRPGPTQVQASDGALTCSSDAWELRKAEAAAERRQREELLAVIVVGTWLQSLAR